MKAPCCQKKRTLAHGSDNLRAGALLDQEVEIRPLRIAHQSREGIGLAARHPEHVVVSNVLEGLGNLDRQPATKFDRTGFLGDEFYVDIGPTEHLVGTGNIEHVDVFVDRDAYQHAITSPG